MCSNLNSRLTPFLLLLFAITLMACSANNHNRKFRFNEKVFTPKQIREDFKVLDRMIRQVHPEPFKRLPKQRYESAALAFYDNIFWPRSERDFYASIASLLGLFKDGHLKAELPERLLNDYILSGGRFFPLTLLINSDAVWVVGDPRKKTNVPVGAQLLYINDQPLGQILSSMANIISFETEAGKRRNIQVQFPFLYWVLNPNKNKFQVTYQWQGKEIQTDLTGKVFDKPVTNTFEQSYYGFEIIDDDTGLLWLNDFNEQQDKFSLFLTSSFEAIRSKAIRRLILDVRYNVGGIADNAIALLQYLNRKPQSWKTDYYIKVSDAFKGFHSNNLRLIKAQKYGASFSWLPVEFFSMLSWELLISSEGTTIKHSTQAELEGNGFSGQIVVLTNGHCLSACAALVAKLKDLGVAKIVGEPVGSYVQEQYVYPLSVNLPNSGLVINIPTTKAVFSQTDVMSGIQTDFFIERSAKDIKTLRDSALDFSLHYFRNSHSY